MQLDLATVSAAPHTVLTSASTAGQLRLSLQSESLFFLRRILDRAITHALDTLDPAALPTFDVSGSPDRVRQKIDAAFTHDGGLAPLILAWLRQDVLDLVSLFTAAAGVDQLRVRLQVVDDNGCRKFHVDHVAFRLLTTYRGPGTEWMPPRLVADAPAGAPLSPHAIRRLERGTIAVMRGGRAATPNCPAVLHRSPPIVGSGQVRLFLAINDLDGVVAVGGI